MITDQKLNEVPNIKDDDYISNIKILNRFAEAFSENTELNKTQLHTRLGINWKYAAVYVVWLKNKGHLKSKKEGRAERYSLTSKGKETFGIASKLHEILSERKSTIAISVVVLIAGLSIACITPLRFY